MKFSYFIKRLRESPFDFILHKVVLAVKKKGLYPFFVVNKYLKLTQDGAINQLEHNITIFSQHFLSEVTKEFSSQQDLIRLKKMSELPLKGLYNCLGFGTVKISGKDSWHTDCIHHHHWPLQYFSNVDFIKPSTR